MSTVTSPTRSVADPSRKGVVTATTNAAPVLPSEKLESRLKIKDLEALQDAFMVDGDGYDNRLNLTRDQFCEALSVILNKGNKEEYGELFDKIDLTKDGYVDWDKLASHMLLEFYEKDDRVKSTQVPQWKDIRHLPSPHKEIIQRVSFLKNTSRYIAISKEGSVSMWGQNMKLQRHLKTGTESCKARDLWVTHFVALQNINKIALAFTSKEIAFYDLSSKLEFNCQYKVQGLDHTPLCLDYWSNPENINEAIITWGDTGGCVNALHFTSVNIALFERPPAPAGEKQDPCLNVQLSDILKKKYKNAKYLKHKGHTEWVRQVMYSVHLECFFSCATTWKNSVIIGWMEKHPQAVNTLKTNEIVVHPKLIQRTTVFQISGGVNAFDYHPDLNLIATAGVNHHVCLWNPYVISKPNGVLRGHMASVIQVQFNTARNQLISFSKDKVLRIWDVQLQVCIQRLAGMFPKGPEVHSTLFFDELRNKLFITFNYSLTLMEMKAEIRDRIMSHDRPVIGALYNQTFNQVISACQGGTVQIWMVDSGQKVKQFTQAHGTAEVTTLAQDETRLFTGSTDGTVKVWDFNGHCFHTLQCGGGQQADVGYVIVLKHSIVVVGWARHVTVFRNSSLKDYHVQPADWKGGQAHSDDILTCAYSGPSMLATGSYDGEIVIWNTSSETASKHLNQRSKRQVMGSRGKTFALASRDSTMVLSKETTQVAEDKGGFDSHAFSSPMRPRTRPKSRAMSRISAGTNDDQNEYGFAISKLIFLEARKNSSASGGANLVSCGGNGWVRFWNTSRNCLVGEFPAHTQVGSIIMAVDKDNHHLVTGDVDGLVKVFNISEYCRHPTDEINKIPPPTRAQWTAHNDIINTIDTCKRNDRRLVITASSDCSVSLWDFDGKFIGTFGQEGHWKIEPYVAPSEDEQMEIEDESEEEEIELEEDEDTVWEPDDRPITDPSGFRMNVWDSSEIGKHYQEMRVNKRERRQPQTIPDLPYLHWEKTGAPPAGPYAALDTFELNSEGNLSKPQFMTQPHKYFKEMASGNGKDKLPVLHDGLKATWDERNLFPRYILEYETKMKQYRQQEKTVNSLKTKSKGITGFGINRNNAPSPNKSRPPVLKPQRLKPIISNPNPALSTRSSSTGITTHNHVPSIIVKDHPSSMNGNNSHNTDDIQE
ncbi:unnamed protein product [Owenia fusiformis]|uniref:Uncharacterized protein n=1 Tax=Owenia fusiformis TaxID=6347 RepID=A0A8J1UGR7_OWEFU|nr:unnamed protein product [Owenia fusiformis]